MRIFYLQYKKMYNYTNHRERERERDKKKNVQVTHKKLALLRRVCLGN